MIKRLVLRSGFFRIWRALRRSFSFRKRMLEELFWMSHFDRRLKSRKRLEGVDLRLGNWALGPAGMSILLDTLTQVRNPRVLELGLGESSKIVAQTLESDNHLVIDHDESWVKHWTTQQEQRGAPVPKIEVFPMRFSKKRSQYDFGEKRIGEGFNVFLVDGPFGSRNESRRNILDIADEWTTNQEFVVIIDDVHRVGELQTYAALKEKLRSKGIGFKSRKITDLKEVGVVCSMHYWQLLSI